MLEYDIDYLSIDGIAERIRPGQRREPVLTDRGFIMCDTKALPPLMAGSKKDAETVGARYRTCGGAVCAIP